MSTYEIIDRDYADVLAQYDDEVSAVACFELAIAASIDFARCLALAEIGADGCVARWVREPSA